MKLSIRKFAMFYNKSTYGPLGNEGWWYDLDDEYVRPLYFSYQMFLWFKELKITNLFQLVFLSAMYSLGVGFYFLFDIFLLPFKLLASVKIK